MLKVRLARFGNKKRPYYHIVVTNCQNKRDGRFIEQIGTYDPQKPMADARVERPRLDYWLGVGALPTETCAKILRENKRALDAVERSSDAAAPAEAQS